MTRTVALCHIDALSLRGARGFDPWSEGRNSMFVVRQGSTLHGYLDRCPHYGDTRLPWRQDAYLDATGEAIVCSSHGARFDIASGKCIIGPCLGRSLTRVPLEVSPAGEILAHFDLTRGI
jgi:nitrite reductase/ring-hydroxylating ferredoxin subunit